MKHKVDMEKQTILVTGSPGFIGANLVIRLLQKLQTGMIISFDSMNDYYNPKLKEYRLGLVEKTAQISPVKHVFIKGNLAENELVHNVFEQYRPNIDNM